MPDSGMYYPNQYFPPVAKIDEYVALVESPLRRRYFRVSWLEPIPMMEKEFLLGPGASILDQEFSEIKVNANEILHFRLSIGGVARVRVSLPRSTKRYVLRNNIAYLDGRLAQFPTFPPQAELALFEDNAIYVDVYNLSRARYEKVKLYVTGYRLVLEEIPQPPPRYAAVVIQGFAGVKR